MAVAAECVWRDPARRPATAVGVAEMLRLAGVPRRGRAALVAPALLVVAVALLALVARGPAIRHAPGGAEPAPAS